nr:hypothetical protein [Tanacetum cinerariifolium]
MIENHSKDRLLKDVLMMELVMHTEKNDTVFHAKKTGMLMLVVEINVGGAMKISSNNHGVTLIIQFALPLLLCQRHSLLLHLNSLP